MSSVFVTVPQFPDVPNLPGVPQLARAIGFAVAGAVAASDLITSLLSSVGPIGLPQNVKAAPIWGVFDGTGEQVVSPDSILDFGYRAEFRVSDFPVQNGQFASYNKVTVPQEISLRMVKGGSLSDRTQFETDCQFVASSLDLYTIITPEKSYIGYNPTRFEIIRRETSGAFFIECEMYFRLIQQITAQYTSVSAAADTSSASVPSALPVQSAGLVQPTAVSPAVQQMVTDYLNGTGPNYQFKYFNDFPSTPSSP